MDVSYKLVSHGLACWGRGLAYKAGGYMTVYSNTLPLVPVIVTVVLAITTKDKAQVYNVWT